MITPAEPIFQIKDANLGKLINLISNDLNLLDVKFICIEVLVIFIMPKTKAAAKNLGASKPSSTATERCIASGSRRTGQRP